ncbi:aspartate/glutamate racemase family protein [Streptomyces sp. NPDC059161]|uniref:aspartate/glutamate racemase family protein n=1 Tax=Streptomyces sp. NPDC059161 TaxID=3346749 RepID=UPI00367E3DEF
MGVLATRGTRAAGLYERAGTRVGLDVVQVPDDVQHACVDPAIRAVKSGAATAGPEHWIASAAGVLKEQGAQVVIAACTEIPLAVRAAVRLLSVVDSADALARCAVERLWRPSQTPFVPANRNGHVISFPPTTAQGRTGPNLRR